MSKKFGLKVKSGVKSGGWMTNHTRRICSVI